MLNPSIAPAYPAARTAVLGRPVRLTWAHVRFGGPLAGVLLLALLLRALCLDATFASSDQAAMGWLLTYSYGIKWIAAHDYGPILPLIERSMAELYAWADWPVDERAVRMPVMLVGMLQVITTWLLLKRMKCSRLQAILGTLVAAVLPILVTDSHYGWGYCTIWLWTGTVALHATLSYLDERRGWWLMAAGLALAAHCLSNCFAFGLPITLAVVWWRAIRSESQHSSLIKPCLIGYVLACLLAVAAVVVCWHWTGAGQLGRLLVKRQVGATGVQGVQVLRLPSMWATMFGYLFAWIAAGGLIWGTRRFWSRQTSVGYLALWAWSSLLPILFFVDWSRVGYPVSYLIDVSWAAGVLGAVSIGAAWSRWADRPRLRLALALLACLAGLHLAVGSADACYRDGRLAAWTGIRTGWGSVKAESGIKAAGWYVRHHVPAEAMVLTVHTNTGMEVPVAEYYAGRAVLASYDLKPGMIQPLLAAMSERLDVVVVDEPRAGVVHATLPGFRRAATFRDGTVPVRHIYARPGLDLPFMDEACAGINERYNAERYASRVPCVRLTAPAFKENLRAYQQLVRNLRTAR